VSPIEAGVFAFGEPVGRDGGDGGRGHHGDDGFVVGRPGQDQVAPPTATTGNACRLATTAAVFPVDIGSAATGTNRLHKVRWDGPIRTAQEPRAGRDWRVTVTISVGKATTRDLPELSETLA
jgi:hypothetical protein